MFAAAIQPVLEELDRSGRLLWQAWFLDDGLLVADETTLREVLGFLSGRFRELGLSVNLAQCCMWTPQGTHAPNSPVPTPSWDEVKVVLGVPFGSAAAQRLFLEQLQDKHHHLLHRLQLFPDPQVALALLRVCLGVQKITHLLRLLWSPLADSFAVEVEGDIRATLEGIIGCGLDDAAWLQSGLPIRLGGLGVQHPTQVQLGAHISSSIAEAAGVFSPGGVAAAPDDDLWEALGRLRDWMGSPADLWTTWLAQRRLPDVRTLVDGEWFLQERWMAMVHNKVAAELLNCVGQRDQVRLRR